MSQLEGAATHHSQQAALGTCSDSIIEMACSVACCSAAAAGLPGLTARKARFQLLQVPCGPAWRGVGPQHSRLELLRIGTFVGIARHSEGQVPGDQ